MRTSRTFFILLLTAAVFAEIVPSVFAQDNLPRALRKKYSDEDYIIRFGSGETAEDASESSRFEIAKYFEAKISGETIVTQWAKSRTKKGKTLEDRLTEISNSIIVGTSRDIPGIEIVSSEYDKRSRSYHVWAVLEKSAYIGILQDRIMGIDNNINSRLENLSGDDLNRIRVYSQIMNDLILREKALQDLTLLGSGAATFAGETALFGVMSSLDSLIADSFDVGLVYKNDVESGVKSGITKGINDAGLRVREYPDSPSALSGGIDLLMTVEHTVKTRVTSKKLNNKEFTFHFADWVLSIQAMDPESQEIIDTLILKDATNGSYEDQTLERMLTKILTVQVPSISKWVYDTIFKPEEM
ncbi:hypothetical protein ACFL6P_07755 [Candidatus Latescibacterota bacterium]